MKHKFLVLTLTLIFVFGLTSLSFADVKISGIYFNTYLNGDPEEAVQLYNSDTAEVDVGGWGFSDILNDGVATKKMVTFATGETIPAESYIWIAKCGDSFAEEFGFDPDYEYTNTDAGITDMTGNGWPNLSTTKDILSLEDDAGDTIDVVAYNDSDTDPNTQSLGLGEIPAGHWDGPPIMLKNLTSLYGRQGMIVRRDHDADGTMDDDSNDSTDWDESRSEIQPGDEEQHRVVYVGQANCEAEGFRIMTPQTGTYKVEMSVSPEFNYGFTVDTIESATNKLELDIYHISNTHICDELVEEMDAGIDVILWSEGCEPGGLSINKKYIMKTIDDHANGSAYYSISADEDDIHDRYRYDHSKVIVVDDGVAFQCGSENFGRTGQPEKTTFGNRGWQVRVTPGTANTLAAADYEAMFSEVCDPVNHKDVLKYENIADVTDGVAKYGYDSGVEESVPTDGDYVWVIDEPAAVETSMTITPIFSPDNALDEVNGIIGMINSATSEILVQQANLKAWWYGLNDDDTFVEGGVEKRVYPNMPLRACLDRAVAQSIPLKIQADDAFFNVDPSNPRNNEVTVDWITDKYTNNGYSDIEAKLFHDNLRGNENNGPLTKTHNKGCIVDGQEVLVASVNWVENSFKGNRESGVIIDNSDVAAFYRKVFLNDWYGPSLPDDLTGGLAVRANGGFISPALVITEVYANPPGSDGAGTPEDKEEFVEILNDSPDWIDVDGYQITDGDATDYLESFGGPDTTVIESGAYAIILDSEYDGDTHAIPYGVVRLTCGNTTIGNGLQTNDPITLKDESGDVIDEWTSASNPGSGKSYEREADGTWQVGPEGGTPGYENDGWDPTQ
jgi:phosphatidylserine/phosphatidylglycerophosphate/cardiolipin synthase-like enzyme